MTAYDYAKMQFRKRIIEQLDELYDPIPYVKTFEKEFRL